MLLLNVVIDENYDTETEEFVYEVYTIRLEHSLVSLSKWESHYEKPFLSDQDKTVEETVSYIKFMALDEVPEAIYKQLSSENISEVNSYIEAKMTATWFSEPRKKPYQRKQVITSELIYYWMIALGIPHEFETWHLNRLLTLIRVCSVKNGSNQKMNHKDRAMAAQERREINARRREKYQTRG